MARPLRIEFEEAIYHLCAWGNARQAIFHDEQDRARFVELLSESAQRFDAGMWIIWESGTETLREIGELFGGVDYAAVAQRIRRTRAAHTAQARSNLITEMLNV